MTKKFEILGLTWNVRLELLDKSFSLSNIQDCFEYILKKQETLTYNFQKEYILTQFKIKFYSKLLGITSKFSHLR